MAEVPAAASAKKTGSKKKDSGPKTPPAHPTYLQMVTEAVAVQKERTGSSVFAISKYIGEHFQKDLPSNYKKILSVQLKKIVKQGKLVKVKNSYKLSEDVKKTIPKKPKAVGTAAASKPKPSKPAAVSPAKAKPAKPATKASKKPAKSPKAKAVVAKPKATKPTKATKKVAAKPAPKSPKKPEAPVATPLKKAEKPAAVPKKAAVPSPKKKPGRKPSSTPKKAAPSPAKPAPKSPSAKKVGRPAKKAKK